MQTRRFLQAQVTAGKTFFILLSGSAYMDTYSVKLGTVPPLSGNPMLTVRGATLGLE